MTWKDRFRAMRMDTTPLRESRDFRLLLMAGTVFYPVSYTHLTLPTILLV